MALGLTQPLTFPGGKGGRCVRLTTLPPSCAVVTKSGKLNFLEPFGSVQACNGSDLPFHYKQFLSADKFALQYFEQHQFVSKNPSKYAITKHWLFGQQLVSSTSDLRTYYQRLHFGFSFSIILGVKFPGNLLKFSKYKKPIIFGELPIICSLLKIYVLVW